MIEIQSLAALREQIGQEIAVSDWFEVTQERITQFAEATEDRHWMHVDAARAAAESPFRTPIAHGFLTLSLVTVLAWRTMTFRGIRLAINYGVDRVRFVSSVPAGSRIRGRFAPLAVDEVRGGVQVTWGVTIEREGGERPCCIAEWVVLFYPEDSNA